MKDLANSRKSGFWRKLKDSNYIIPIIIVVFLLFGISALFTGVVIYVPDVEESNIVVPEYVIFYELPALEGDSLEITYVVEDDLPITLYIFNSEAWKAYPISVGFSSTYIIADKSSGDITYTIPADDDYFIVFESWNDDPVMLDVKIMNQTVVFYGYICYLPVTLFLFILLTYLLIPKEMLPDPESETSQFDYYNIDNTNGYILFGLGWFFGLSSVIFVILYIQSVLLSDSLMDSFYIFVGLALTILACNISFSYSESYGYKNPWKLFLK